jgi:hypothetical protein
MTAFTFETVDGGANPAGLCCLALDKAGNPRIAFAGPQGEIKLAQRNAGAWSVEDVTAGEFVAKIENSRVWLQIDSLGNPHVAYRGALTGHLIYGVKRGDHWTFQALPTSTSHGVAGLVHLAFMLHPDFDTPHFIFTNLTDAALGYTRMIGGAFKTTAITGADPLDDLGVITNGLLPSAVLDPSSGAINVSYVMEVGSGRHKLRWKRILDPTADKLSVEQETLSAPQPLGEGIFIRLTSIAATFRDRCVAHYDGADRSLKVSLPNGPVPITQIVAQNIAATIPSAAQHGGLYRVAFADGNQVKLALRDRFTNWTVETVDAAGGAMPSLAYGNANNCHIGYVSGGTLKYATRKEEI